MKNKKLEIIIDKLDSINSRLFTGRVGLYIVAKHGDKNTDYVIGRTCGSSGEYNVVTPRMNLKSLGIMVDLIDEYGRVAHRKSVRDNNLEKRKYVQEHHADLIASNGRFAAETGYERSINNQLRNEAALAKAELSDYKKRMKRLKKVWDNT